MNEQFFQNPGLKGRQSSAMGEAHRKQATNQIEA